MSKKNQQTESRPRIPQYDWLTPVEAGKLMGYKTPFYLQVVAIKHGIPHYRIGGRIRFKREDVEAYIAQARVVPPPKREKLIAAAPSATDTAPTDTDTADTPAS